MCTHARAHTHTPFLTSSAAPPLLVRLRRSWRLRWGLARKRVAGEVSRIAPAKKQRKQGRVDRPRWTPQRRDGLAELCSVEDRELGALHPGPLVMGFGLPLGRGCNLQHGSFLPGQEPAVSCPQPTLLATRGTSSRLVEGRWGGPGQCPRQPLWSELPGCLTSLLTGLPVSTLVLTPVCSPH